MPAWLIAALSGLRGIVIPAGRATRTALVGTRGRTALTAGGAGFALPGFLGGDDDGERVRRRRRRRALTQSDRNDIAFIAATISKAAAGSFAVQLATRSR